MAVKTVTDAEFEAEVLQSSTPVLVDFWAEWCGPCKAFAPTLDEYAKEAGGGVKVVKVNVDQNPHAPTKYGVRAIPTLMVFKGGAVVAQTAGAMPKARLQEWVEKAL